jgi:hypothetical protein
MLIQIRQGVHNQRRHGADGQAVILDLYTPLGVADHVLCIGPVLLALLSPHRMQVWYIDQRRKHIEQLQRLTE